MEELFDCKTDERLAVLQDNLSRRAEVCSSGGIEAGFPACMSGGCVNFGIGLIGCPIGKVDFNLSGRNYTANEGTTGFIPGGAKFREVRQSPRL